MSVVGRPLSHSKTHVHEISLFTRESYQSKWLRASVHVQSDAMLSTNANATMQDGEMDALVKLRRGVNVYDGSADHDGRLG